jgi:two-component system chemotaxis sensor kinase CheA
MGLDPEILHELREVFAVELEELLQQINDGLLGLEQGLGGAQRQAALEHIFRAAHNIKGAARGVELIALSELAHALESLFSHFKENNIQPSGEIIDVALAGSDGLRELMAAHREQRAPQVDSGQLMTRITQVCAPSAAAPAAETGAQATIAEPTAEPTEQPAPRQPANARGSEFVHITLERLEQVAALAEELQVAKIEMADHLAAVQQMNTRARQLADHWRRQGVSEASPGSLETLLRTASQLAGGFEDDANQLYKALRASTSRLDLLVSTLQNDVRMLHMVPLSTLLRPMARSVRDLARELGKQVEFGVAGDDIDVDRTVLDNIRNPLMHLLRNAIDHGIETPAQRLEAGKPPTGEIMIRVYREGGLMFLQVADDGGGIEPEQIANTARDKHLVSANELRRMGRDDLLKLIFRPGFSSKQIITDISGRGVGLDVVQSNLRSLHGSVSVDSQAGSGTRFTLRIPITLISDHGVLVRCANALYAIPTTAVERVMDVRADELVDVEAGQSIVLDGRPLPARELAEVLELPVAKRAANQHLSVVVLAKGWESVALVVDEIVGEREMVIKPLRPPLLSVRNVSGGTLTGNGDIIMVLNPADLVVSALRPGSGSRRIGGTADEVPAQRILVVDDSITTRMLEKNILQSAGYDVSLAVDGSQAWEILQEHLFDLIVTDIEMPKLNGFDLTQRIRQEARLKDVPVIIVTSLSAEHERQRGIDVGADAYIVKGQFETRALLDAVGHLI